jgi:hypothetical protein
LVGDDEWYYEGEGEEDDDLFDTVGGYIVFVYSEEGLQYVLFELSKLLIGYDGSHFDLLLLLLLHF